MYCFWDDFAVEAQLNATDLLLPNLHVKKYLMGDTRTFRGENEAGDEEKNNSKKQGYWNVAHLQRRNNKAYFDTVATADVVRAR